MNIRPLNLSSDLCRCPRCRYRRMTEHYTKPEPQTGGEPDAGEHECRLAYSDLRHPDMFELDAMSNVLTVFWSGDIHEPYDITLASVSTPEKLLGFLQFVGAVGWEHATQRRIGYLIEALARHFEWDIQVFWD